MKFKSLFFSGLLVSTSSLFAAETDIFSLSLEELLNVSVASKQEEKLVDAGSVITVISQDKIEKFGGRHLRDVLDRVVNTQIIGSNLYPHNRVSLRGVTQTHTNNKVLILLNGNVIRDGNSGGTHTDIFNFLPIQWIKKIEIIRGPGSVIYGSNAFAGVVNVITFRGDDELDLLSINGGSFDTSGASAFLSGGSEKKNFSLGAQYIDAEGDSFENIQGEFGTSGTYPMDKNGYQVIANAQYKDFYFNGLYSDTKQGHVKSLFQFPASTLELITSHFDLKYDTLLNENWQLTAHYTYNEQDFISDISNTRSTRTNSKNNILEATVHGRVNKYTGLLVGINHELIKGVLGEGTTNETPFHTYQMGFFAQGNWDIGEHQEIIAGIQLNKPEDLSSEASPRLSYIYKITPKWTFKMLYGEAFRSAYGSALFLNSPSLQGNPDLRPETIKTLDLQFIRQTDNSYATLTLYKSKHKDLHKREVINGTPTFINSGVIDYYGIELEYLAQLGSYFEVDLNASYQQNENEIGLEQTTYNPETMVKLGIAFDSKTGINGGVYENYFSEPTQPEEIGILPIAFNQEPQAYHLVTANINFHLNTLFNWQNAPETKVTLYIDNLLDEDIYFPSINRTAVNSLPHHAGRGYYLSVDMRF